MKAFIVAVAFGLAFVAQAAALTREVLVLTTATAITRTAKSRAFELQNLGPNAIHCCVAGTPVANKCRKIDASGTWAADLPAEIDVSCLASTANQVTGAATIITEIP
jgi:hypothetical protein